MKPALMNDARANFERYITLMEKGVVSKNLCMDKIMHDLDKYLDAAYNFGKNKKQ